MSFELKGLDDLQKQLEKKFGNAGMKSTVENALINGAKEFDKVLKPELEKFKDTGATVDDTTYKKEFITGKNPSIKIHWNSTHERYRLIHLNEHGYTRNGKKYRPRGYGAIARALAKGKPVYYAAIKKELERKL